MARGIMGINKRLLLCWLCLGVTVARPDVWNTARRLIGTSSMKPLLDGQIELVMQQIRTLFKTLTNKLVAAKCPEVTQHTYPELYALLADLSKRAGIALPRVFIIEHNSVHDVIMRVELGVSIECNAMAYSLDADNQVIFLDADLLDLLTEAQLRGVIMHELSHIVCGHSQKTVRAALAAVSVCFLASIIASVPRYLPNTMPERRFWQITSYCWGASISLTVVTALVLAWVKRRFERQADALATRLLRDRTWIVALALLEDERARRYPFTEVLQTNIMRWLGFFGDHPSFEQRAYAVEQEVFDKPNRNNNDHK